MLFFLLTDQRLPGLHLLPRQRLPPEIRRNHLIIGGYDGNDLCPQLKWTAAQR
jgi:hypothetical protein